MVDMQLTTVRGVLSSSGVVTCRRNHFTLPMCTVALLIGGIPCVTCFRESWSQVEGELPTYDLEKAHLLFLCHICKAANDRFGTYLRRDCLLWSDMSRPKCGKPLTLELRQVNVEGKMDD